MERRERPPGYTSEELGDYEACFSDSSCGETVAWGFPILKHLGEEKFEALKKFGTLECRYGGPGGGKWFLIVKRFTHEQAIEKFGEVTGEERGPRGGFRSRTYGTTKFLSDLTKYSQGEKP